MIIGLLSGLFVAGTIATEIISASNYAQWPRGDEGLYSCLEPKKPTQPTQPEKPKVKKVFKSRQQWWDEYLACQRELNNKTAKMSPFEQWTIDNADKLVELLKKPEFLLAKSEYEGINGQEIVDFLFKQKNVESVEETDQGIFVMTRGGGV